MSYINDLKTMRKKLEEGKSDERKIKDHILAIKKKYDLKPAEIEIICQLYDKDLGRLKGNALTVGHIDNFTFMSDCSTGKIMGYDTANSFKFCYTKGSKYPWTSKNSIAYKKIAIEAINKLTHNPLIQKYVDIRYLVQHIDELRKIAKQCNWIKCPTPPDHPTGGQPIPEPVIKKDAAVSKIYGYSAKEINNMSAMKLAHIIRKTDKLEGDYQACMKLALKMAWQIKNNLPVDSSDNNVSKKNEIKKDKQSAVPVAEKDLSIKELQNQYKYMVLDQNESITLIETKHNKIIKSLENAYINNNTLSLLNSLAQNINSPILVLVSKDYPNQQQFPFLKIHNQKKKALRA